jgi:hypothetical protein
MKFLGYISKIIIGIVFIFSGVVKAIDPLGSAYKFQDYFQAFHIDFLKSMSLPLAILLCTAEFISGFSVLTGIRQKAGFSGVLILMLIFTPLTLVLALTNPVSDCGCFGDAIHLTNWQTFWKNIVLLVLVFCIKRSGIIKHSTSSKYSEWIVITGTTVVFVLFSLYNLRYLPVIDFLPYKIGINISEKMVIPEGVASDEYSTTFTYKKNGMNKEFSLDNYPANDTTWKFVSQNSILIRKGYQPPIHDFVITNLQNEDITQKILTDTGYTVLMVTKKIEEADGENLRKGFELGQYLKDTSKSFYILTASGSDEISKFNNSLQFCLMDETTLKTIIRSNPGYLLIKGGKILGKWSWANIPDNKKTGKFGNVM